jgi:hypothetical protein
MKYLIFCMCGHALDRHERTGCEGDGHLPCACPRDQESALDSAIEDARSHPWGSVTFESGARFEASA